MVVSLNRWKGKVAVVTGASAGIGAAICEQLVEAGCNVVGIARRKDRIDELAKKLQHKPGKLYAVKADLSKEDEIIAAFKWIRDNVGPVSILINNAGFMKSTSLMDGDTELWKAVFNTNVIGLSIATREAIKDMKTNNIDGHIIHMNSVAGHRIPQFPNINVYPASKYAVTALAETLRNELNTCGSKIKITSVSPGAVETEFVEAGGIPTTPDMKTMMKSMPFLKAGDIADAVLYVLGTPPHVQIPELTITPIGSNI